MPTLAKFPMLRAVVKMHNKGRMSVTKSIREEMGLKDGDKIALIQWGPGTFIFEKHQKQADSYRSFQPG